MLLFGAHRPIAPHTDQAEAAASTAQQGFLLTGPGKEIK